MKFTRTVCVVAILAASAYGLLTGAMPSVQSGQWAPAGEMSVARDGAVSVLLPGGRVLIAGGESAGAALATTEVFDISGTFSAEASMETARARHAAVLLEDGRALVIGGRNGADAVGSAEAYASGTWAAAGELVDPRWGHTATLLADGRVLVAGGENAGGPLASVEIFDPATGQFTYSGAMTAARAGHAAARLHDGRVLLAGGFTGDGVVTSIDVFDAETGVLASLPSALLAPRAGLTATTLLDGRVLFFGGYDGSQDVATGELFDPATGGLTPSASATTARRDHQAFLLPNNNAVLVVGGASGTEALASAELYLPWLDQFRATGSMSVPRAFATGVRLSDETYGLFPTTGHLPVMGGSSPPSWELYGFATIRVDRDDYLPGDTVYFSAAGWQPNETLTVTLQELPEEHGARTFNVKADVSGRVVNLALFQVEDHHLGVHFELTTRGAAAQAMTRFTDGNPQAVNITPGSRTVTAGNSAEYAVQVVVGGNSDLCTVTLAVTAGLPTGASASFNGNVVETNETFSRTLTIATTASTAAGSYPFTLTAFRGSDCQGNQNSHLTQTGTLVVTAGTVATETVASAASATYGDASVTLSAAVSRVGDSALVSGGTVAFTLTSGSTVVGGTTSGVVVDGTASISYALPAGLSAGTYAVEAEFGGASGLDASSGTSSLTVGKATATISVTGKTVTYDGSVHGASGTATGVSGIDLSASLDLGDSFTNAPGGTANWSFIGGTNYNDASGSVGLVIEKADATINVAGGTFTYDGTAKGATGSATGIGGVALAGLELGASFTNVPGGTANWTFTDATGNYNSSSGSVAIVINKAASSTMVVCDAGPFTYTGAPQTPCSASVTGAGGLNEPVTVTYADNVNAGTATASASYAESTNHLASGDSTTFNIGKAASSTTVVCDAGPFTYTGAPQTPCSASVTGAGGLNEPVTVTYADNVNAGTATASASYAESVNHLSSGDSTTFEIGKANATIVVDGGTFTYDGAAKGATGTAKGVDNEALAGLDLGDTFTNVPGGTANWTFTDVTGNYNNSSGSVAIVINKAATATVVTCGAGPFTYTGAAQTPCAASVTGAGGLNESVTVTYANNVNAGTATASASYTESANHLTSSNSTAFTIGKTAVTVTADDQHQNYGLPLAPFTVDYAGLVGGETPSVLQGALAFAFAGIAPTTYGPSTTAPVNAGTYRITPSGLTSGNYTITFVNGTLTIASWWTLNGFTQPVGIQNSVVNNTVPNAATVWNIVKGGSTVPLKFNVFADTVEKNSLADIAGFTQQAVACAGSSVPVESVAEELLTTGNTSLSYAGGQFHQNWKTPKVGANTCYRATVTTKDGSTLSAFFVLRK